MTEVDAGPDEFFNPEEQEEQRRLDVIRAARAEEIRGQLAPWRVHFLAYFIRVDMTVEYPCGGISTFTIRNGEQFLAECNDAEVVSFAGDAS